jgi:hypothetical protein
MRRVQFEERRTCRKKRERERKMKEEIGEKETEKG